MDKQKSPYITFITCEGANEPPEFGWAHDKGFGVVMLMSSKGQIWNPDDQPYLETVENVKIEVDGKEYTFVAHNFAPRVDAEELKRKICKMSTALGLVFSPTAKPSFDAVARQYKDIRSIEGCETVPIFLVAVRCHHKDAWQVTRDEIMNYSSSIGAPIFEFYGPAEREQAYETAKDIIRYLSKEHPQALADTPSSQPYKPKSYRCTVL